MVERISSEEARTVKLSLNPIKRLGQLAEYGAAFNLKKVGWSPLPLYMTRGDLIRTALARERGEILLEMTDAVEDRGPVPQNESGEEQ